MYGIFFSSSYLREKSISFASSGKKTTHKRLKKDSYTSFPWLFCHFPTSQWGQRVTFLLKKSGTPGKILFWREVLSLLSLEF
jgi:hypothetical protein